LSQKYDSIYFAVGVHPYDAKAYNRDFLERFIKIKVCSSWRVWTRLL